MLYGMVSLGFGGSLRISDSELPLLPLLELQLGGHGISCICSSRLDFVHIFQLIIFYYTLGEFFGHIF